MGKSSSGRSRTGSEVTSSKSEKRRSTIDETESTSTVTPSRTRSGAGSTVSGDSSRRRRSSKRYEDDRDDVSETPTRPASNYSTGPNAPTSVSSSYVIAVDRDGDSSSRRERHGSSRREKDHFSRSESYTESSRSLDNHRYDDKDLGDGYSRRASEKSSSSGRRRDPQRQSSSSSQTERKESRRDSEREVSRAMNEHDLDAARPQNQFPGAFPEEYAAPYIPPSAGLASEYYGDQGESVQYQPGVRPNKPSIIYASDQAHLHQPTVEAKPPPEPSSMGLVGAAASFYSMDDSTSTVQPSTPSRPIGYIESGQPDMNSSRPSNSRPAPPSSSGSGFGIGTIGAAAITGAAVGAAADFYSGSNSQMNQNSSSSQSYQQSSQQNQYSYNSSSAYDQTSQNQYDQGSQAGQGSSSQYIQGSQGEYGTPSKPPQQGPSGSGFGTVAAAAGVAAAGAAYLSHQHHNEQSYSNSNSQIQSQFQGQHGFTLGQGQSAFPKMQSQQLRRHKHRGPMGRFVDWFRDPSGVAQFEEYTEYIGVCRYCFDPHSTPVEAPRKHHYHGGRPSSINPEGRITSTVGRTSRVSKTYRHSNSSSSSLSSNEREKHRKSFNGAKIIAAGLAGAAAGKVGEEIFTQRHDFDDIYSVRSGIPQTEMQQRMSTSASQMRAEDRIRMNESRFSEQRHSESRRSRKDSGDDRRRQSRTQMAESSTQERSRGQGMSVSAETAAGAAAVGMAALAGAEMASRRRSRSRSRSRSSSHSRRTVRRKKSYSHKRVSPKHSYVDLRGKNTGTLGFGAFFSSPSANERKGKKSKGFFTFSNGSGSSSDADLAFGEGTVKRKNSKKGKSQRESSGGAADTAAMLGLVAAGAALASESDRRSEKRRSKRESFDERSRRSAHRRSSSSKIKIADNETATSDIDDPMMWEDVPEDDGVDLALAYGGRLSARNSRESLAEQGTSKWDWRWKSKDKEKEKSKRSESSGADRRQNESFTVDGVAATALGAGIGAAAASTIGSNRWPVWKQNQQNQQNQPSQAPYTSSSPANLPPMQFVEPLATTDPKFFGAARQQSTVTEQASPYTLVSRSSAPLQQPQPSVVAAPKISSVQPTVLEQFESKVISSPEDMTSGEERRMKRRNRADSEERVRPKSTSTPPLTNPSISSRTGVTWQLTEEQIEKERQALEKDESRQRKRDRRSKRDSAESVIDSPSSSLTDSPKANRKSASIIELDQKESEINDRLKALYAEQDAMREEQNRQVRQQVKLEKYRQKHGESSGIAAALVVAGIGATTAALLKDYGSKKTSESDKSESDGKPRRKSSLKSVSRDRPSTPPRTSTPPRAQSPPATEKSEPRPRSPPTVRQSPPRVDTPLKASSPPKETQQERMARMAAQKVRSRSPSPSPVHENYADFFTPEELSGKVKERNEIAAKREHDFANVITIEPDDDGNLSHPVFDPLVYETYGSSTDHNSYGLGWSVPFLQLVEPTPPSSRSASRIRVDEEDVDRSAQTAEEGSNQSSSRTKSSASRASKDDPAKPADTSSSAGSKVTWGRHDTYEYEVQSPESERTDPYSDQGDSNSFLPLNENSSIAKSSEPSRKEFKIEREDDVSSVKVIPSLEEMSREQPEYWSRGRDFADIPSPDTAGESQITSGRRRDSAAKEPIRPYSPSPDPTPIAEPELRDYFDGGSYKSPFAETVSDIGDIGDYRRRDTPKTGQGSVEESSLPVTPAVDTSSSPGDILQLSTKSPSVAIDDIPAGNRESRSQRRRLERAMSSSENVTPVTRTPDPEFQSAEQPQDHTATNGDDESADYHHSGEMPGSFGGVFDYLVDEEGNSLPASSAHDYEDAARSAMTQTSRMSESTKSQTDLSRTSETPAKPKRSSTFDCAKYERDNTRDKANDYASDPEDWERHDGKKSKATQEASSKSETGLGTNAALAGAGAAVGVFAPTVAARSSEPDFYAGGKEKSRDRKKKRDFDVSEDLEAKSSVSLPATREEEKKHRRKRDSDRYDDEVNRSVISLPATKEDDYKSKSRNRESDRYDDEMNRSVTSLPSSKDDEYKSRSRKRDSEMSRYDDDDAKSTVSASSEKRRSKHKEVERKSSSGGLFSGLFSKSNDGSTTSKKSRKSSKSEPRVERDRDRDRDKDDRDRERHRKRRSGSERYEDDTGSIISESTRSSRRTKSREAANMNKSGQDSRDVSVDDSFVSADEAQEDQQGSFLARRPDMPTPMATVTAMDIVTPMGTDGVSGPKSGRSTVTPSAQFFNDDRPGEDITPVKPESLPLPVQSTDEERSLSEGEHDFQMPAAITTPTSDRQRRLSAIRTGELPSSPALIQSPTAARLSRRYPVTPSSANQNPNRSSPVIASPVTPIQTSKLRQGRPKSSDFSSSREFRPLYLVETHSASKTPVSAEDEELPSLPPSRTSSLNPSMENLRGRALDQLDEEDDVEKQTTPSKSRKATEEDDHRSGSPDFLDSRSATPVPGETQRARDQEPISPVPSTSTQPQLSLEEIRQRKAKQFEREQQNKLLFHSPSELLQDPQYSALVQPQDVHIYQEEQITSPLPSVVSTSQDEEFMSAESGSATPVETERRQSRARSPSRERSRSGHRDAALATGVGVLGGAAAGYALNKALQHRAQEEGIEESESERALEHGISHAESSSAPKANMSRNSGFEPQDDHLARSDVRIQTRKSSAFSVAAAREDDGSQSAPLPEPNTAEEEDWAASTKKGKKDKKKKRKSGAFDQSISSAAFEESTQDRQKPSPEVEESVSTRSHRTASPEELANDTTPTQCRRSVNSRRERSFDIVDDESSKALIEPRVETAPIEQGVASEETPAEDDWSMPVSGKKSEKDRKNKRKSAGFIEELSERGGADSRENVQLAISEPLALTSASGVNAGDRRLSREVSGRTPFGEEPAQEVPAAEDDWLVPAPSKKSKKEKKGKGKSKSVDDALAIDTTVAAKDTTDDSQPTTALPISEDGGERRGSMGSAALGVGTGAAIAAGSGLLLEHERSAATDDDQQRDEIPNLPELTRSTSFQPSAAELADPYNDLGALEQAFEQALQSRGLATGVSRKEALDAFLPKRDNAPFVPNGGLTPVPEGTPVTAPKTPTSDTGTLSRKSSKRDKKDRKKKGIVDSDPNDNMSSLDLPTAEASRGLSTDLAGEPASISAFEGKNPFDNDFEVRTEVHGNKEPDVKSPMSSRNPFGSDYEIKTEEQSDDHVAPVVADENEEFAWTSTSEKDKKKKRKSQQATISSGEVGPQELPLEKSSQEDISKDISKDILGEVAREQQDVDQDSKSGEPHQAIQDDAESWEPISKKDKKKKRKSQISTFVDEVDSPAAQEEQDGRNEVQRLSEDPSEPLTRDLDSAMSYTEAVPPKTDPPSWASNSKKDKKKKKKGDRASTDAFEISEPATPVDEPARNLAEQMSERPVKSISYPAAKDEFSIPQSSKKSKKDKRISKTEWIDLAAPAAIIAGGAAAGMAVAGMLIDTDGRTEIVEEPKEIEASPTTGNFDPQSESNINRADDTAADDFAPVSGKKIKKDRKKKSKSSTFDNWEDIAPSESSTSRDLVETALPPDSSSSLTSRKSDIIGPAVPEVSVRPDHRDMHEGISAGDESSRYVDEDQIATSADVASEPHQNANLQKSTDTGEEDWFISTTGKKSKKDKKKKRQSMTSDEIPDDIIVRSPENDETQRDLEDKPVPKVDTSRSIDEPQSKADISIEQPREDDAGEWSSLSKGKKGKEDKKDKRRSVTWSDEIVPSTDSTHELQPSNDSEDGKEQFIDAVAQTKDIQPETIEQANSGLAGSKNSPSRENADRELDLDPTISDDDGPIAPIPQAQPIEDWTAPGAANKKRPGAPAAPWDNDIGMDKAFSLAFEGAAVSIGAAIAKKKKAKAQAKHIPSSFEPYVPRRAKDETIVGAQIWDTAEAQRTPDAEPIETTEMYEGEGPAHRSMEKDASNAGVTSHFSIAGDPALEDVPDEVAFRVPKLESDFDVTRPAQVEAIEEHDRSTDSRLGDAPEAEAEDSWFVPSSSKKSKKDKKRSKSSAYEDEGRAMTVEEMPKSTDGQNRATPPLTDDNLVKDDLAPENIPESASGAATTEYAKLIVGGDVSSEQLQEPELPWDYGLNKKKKEKKRKSMQAEGIEFDEYDQPIYPKSSQRQVAEDESSQDQATQESTRAEPTGQLDDTDMTAEPTQEQEDPEQSELPCDYGLDKKQKAKKRKSVQLEGIEFDEEDQPIYPVYEVQPPSADEPCSADSVTEQGREAVLGETESAAVEELEPQCEVLDEPEMPWDHGLSKKARKDKKKAMIREGIEFDVNDQPIYPNLEEHDLHSADTRSEPARPQIIEDEEFTARQEEEMQPEAVDDPELAWDHGLSKKARKEKKKSKRKSFAIISSEDVSNSKESVSQDLEMTVEPEIASAADGEVEPVPREIPPDEGEWAVPVTGKKSKKDKKKGKRDTATESDSINPALEGVDKDVEVLEAPTRADSEDKTTQEPIQIPFADSVQDSRSPNESSNVNSELVPDAFGEAEPEDDEWAASSTKKGKKDKKKRKSMVTPIAELATAAAAGGALAASSKSVLEEVVEPTTESRDMSEPFQEVDEDECATTTPKTSKKNQKKRQSTLATLAEESTFRANPLTKDAEFLTEPTTINTRTEAVTDINAGCEVASPSTPAEQFAAEDEWAMPSISKKAKKDKKKRKSMISLAADEIVDPTNETAREPQLVDEYPVSEPILAGASTEVMAPVDEFADASEIVQTATEPDDQYRATGISKPREYPPATFENDLLSSAETFFEPTTKSTTEIVPDSGDENTLGLPSKNSKKDKKERQSDVLVPDEQPPASLSREPCELMPVGTISLEETPVEKTSDRNDVERAGIEDDIWAIPGKKSKKDKKKRQSALSTSFGQPDTVAEASTKDESNWDQVDLVDRDRSEAPDNVSLQNPEDVPSQPEEDSRYEIDKKSKKDKKSRKSGISSPTEQPSTPVDENAREFYDAESLTAPVEGLVQKPTQAEPKDDFWAVSSKKSKKDKKKKKSGLAESTEALDPGSTIAAESSSRHLVESSFQSGDADAVTTAAAEESMVTESAFGQAESVVEDEWAITKKSSKKDKKKKKKKKNVEAWENEETNFAIEPIPTSGLLEDQALQGQRPVQQTLHTETLDNQIASIRDAPAKELHEEPGHQEFLGNARRTAQKFPSKSSTPESREADDSAYATPEVAERGDIEMPSQTRDMPDVTAEDEWSFTAPKKLKKDKKKDERKSIAADEDHAAKLVAVTAAAGVVTVKHEKDPTQGIVTTEPHSRDEEEIANAKAEQAVIDDYVTKSKDVQRLEDAEQEQQVIDDYIDDNSPSRKDEWMEVETSEQDRRREVDANAAEFVDDGSTPDDIDTSWIKDTKRTKKDKKGKRDSTGQTESPGSSAALAADVIFKERTGGEVAGERDFSNVNEHEQATSSTAPEDLFETPTETPVVEKQDEFAWVPKTKKGKKEKKRQSVTWVEGDTSTPATPANEIIDEYPLEDAQATSDIIVPEGNVTTSEQANANEESHAAPQGPYLQDNSAQSSVYESNDMSDTKPDPSLPTIEKEESHWESTPSKKKSKKDKKKRGSAYEFEELIVPEDAPEPKSSQILSAAFDKPADVEMAENVTRDLAEAEQFDIQGQREPQIEDAERDSNAPAMSPGNDDWAVPSKKSRKDKKKRKGRNEGEWPAPDAAVPAAVATATVSAAAAISALHRSKSIKDADDTGVADPETEDRTIANSHIKQGIERSEAVEDTEMLVDTKKSKKDKTKKKQRLALEDTLKELTSEKSSADSVITREPEIVEESVQGATRERSVDEEEWALPGKETKKGKKKRQSVLDEVEPIGETPIHGLHDRAGYDEQKNVGSPMDYEVTNDSSERGPGQHFARDTHMTGVDEAEQPPHHDRSMKSSNVSESLIQAATADMLDDARDGEHISVEGPEKFYVSKRSKRDKKKKNKDDALTNEPYEVPTEDNLARRTTNSIHQTTERSIGEAATEEIPLDSAEDFYRTTDMGRRNVEEPLEWSSSTKKSKKGEGKKSQSAISASDEFVSDAQDSSRYSNEVAAEAVLLQRHDVEHQDDPSTYHIADSRTESRHLQDIADTRQQLAEGVDEWAIPDKNSKKDKKKRKSILDATESSRDSPRASRESQAAITTDVGPEVNATSVDTIASPRHSVENLHQTPEHQEWLANAYSAATRFPSKPTSDTKALRESQSEGLDRSQHVVTTERGEESDGSNVSASTRERRKRRRSPPLQRDHDSEDLPRGPRDGAMTPPPEHDDMMDTALGIAAGLGFGATQHGSTGSKSIAEEHVRDSGVQFDSPIMPQSHFSTLRDSGYDPSSDVADTHLTSSAQVHPASAHESRRPTRPHSPTSSSENVRASRRSFQIEIEGNNRHDAHKEDQSRQILETPSKRLPSPVDSSSKERSSVLFQSSPAGQTPNAPRSDGKTRKEAPQPINTTDLRRTASIHGHRSVDAQPSSWSSPQPRRLSNELASNLIDRSAAAVIDPVAFNTTPQHGLERGTARSRTPLQSIPESHPRYSDSALMMGTAAAGGLGATVLGTTSRDDPTTRGRSLGKSKSRTSSLRDLRGNATSPFNGPQLHSTPLRGAVDDPASAAEGVARNMADSYEGYGSYPASPRSPTRPPSVKKRQSMQQINDLQARVDQLANENRGLAEAKLMAERHLDEFRLDRNKADFASEESFKVLNEQLRQRDEEITKLRAQIDSLLATHETWKIEHETKYSELHERHSQAHTQWQESSRELEELRVQHEELNSGMEDIVRDQIDTALAQKNAEVQRLRQDLDAAREKIRGLQAQILAHGEQEIVTVRDEDYFDNACQTLCQHVQQWVLRFSKFSDTRVCYSTEEVRDEKVVDRFDNAMLDGTEADSYLSDRIKRRDIFMSVVMTMIWEYVFARYLFGMDREQRQKLRQLEKNLNEVGPPNAVHQWRAITLTLLSKREAFQQQRESDTEAVVIEIMKTLKKFLPPPQNLEGQIHESLRKVMRAAVDLSIEMRTQKAEYIMLPPLQPEYDTNGDLARKVYFNASLMNERSGETTSNDDLEAQSAIVRIVLFPLVVKKGDDSGKGTEEIVVCPAQVLVARPDRAKRPKSRLASGGSDRMSMDQRGLKGASTHSLGAMSGIEPSNVI